MKARALLAGAGIVVALAGCDSGGSQDAGTPSAGYGDRSRTGTVGVGMSPNGKVGVMIEVAPGIGMDPGTGKVGPMISLGP